MRVALSGARSLFLTSEPRKQSVAVNATERHACR